jgi:SAM-dependent methyltransferase
MNTLEYLVQKYNLDLTQPSPIEIPGIGRLDLLRWLRELNFKKAVEVGVAYGSYSELMCNINPQIKVWGVDPYQMYKEYREFSKAQSALDSAKKQAQDLMSSYVDHDLYEFVFKFSEDAAKDFADESLDFVYIDANHEFDFPYRDIKTWYPKVKKGGILAGHDFVRTTNLTFTIKDALEKFTKEEKINPWFVLGSYSRKTGEVRDRTRSWVIIK